MWKSPNVVDADLPLFTAYAPESFVPSSSPELLLGHKHGQERGKVQDAVDLYFLAASALEGRTR